MRSNFVVLMIVSALTVLSAASVASAEDVAAHVGIATISPCPSFCGPVPPGHTDFAFNGGPGSTSAAALINNIDGNGRGRAALNGDSLLPVIGAEAFSNPNARVSVNALGYRSYLYTGATSTSTSVDLVLDGIVNDPGSNDGSVQASIAVIRRETLPFVTDFGTLVFELVAPSELLGTAVINIPANAGLQSVPGSIPFDLDPSDKIFVWTGLTASGTRSGSGDAFNTLTASFSDSTGLVPLPEPATAAFLLIPAVVMVVRRSR